MDSSPPRPWTIFGLGIALFGIPLVATISRWLGGSAPSDGLVIMRELSIAALALLLIWIIRSREGMTLQSINWRTDRLGRSLVRGLLITLACFVVLAACLMAFSSLGVRYGDGPGIARALPITLLAVIRAGVVEELFYRGFAIERLEALTGSKWLAGVLPLLAFSAFHFSQGVAGMVLALLLGAVLTAFYLWKRDLAAAIIAHFLVDFIPNIALPAIGAAG